jgi:Protein of unknown function (DUF559)
MAAVLAVGSGAALSHRSAAALWGLRRTARPKIDVTTPRRAHHRAVIQVHRVRALPDDDVTTVSGIPCTTVARTLLDLAEVLPRLDIERAIEQAELINSFDGNAVSRVLARHPTRRASLVLRKVLRQYEVGWGMPRSELEERFLALCARADIRRPKVNVPLAFVDDGTAIVDALWRRERLVVETDGRAVHGTRAAFERDRRRDAQLLLAGFRVARFTWRQVTQEGSEVAAILRALLGGDGIQLARAIERHR